MSGNRGLMDSNVIIDAAKGRISIQDIVNRYDHLYTSLICYAETLGYCFDDDDEQAIITEILTNIEIVNPDITIADIAIGYRKKKKIKLPDAFILATAKQVNADLLTSNIADFHYIDPNVNIISPT